MTTRTPPDGAQGEATPPPWLIFNVEDHVYWRANRSGYTCLVDRAGRYSTSEALAICGLRTFQPARPGRPVDIPAEVMVPSPEAIKAVNAHAQMLAALKAEEAARAQEARHDDECSYASCDFRGCPHDFVQRALDEAVDLRRAAISAAEPEGGAQ